MQQREGEGLLLPCPFCGDDEELGTRQYDGYWWAVCGSCSARVGAETENGAIAGWNERTQPPASEITPEIDTALREAHRASTEYLGPIPASEGSITLDNRSVQRLMDYGLLHHTDEGWTVGSWQQITEPASEELVTDAVEMLTRQIDAMELLDADCHLSANDLREIRTALQAPASEGLVTDAEENDCCPPHCCCCDVGEPCCDCGEVRPSAACQGEKCFCGKPAAKKIGEEILFDDPVPNRHNLTSYVCARHYALIMGPTGSKQVGVAPAALQAQPVMVVTDAPLTNEALVLAGYEADQRGVVWKTYGDLEAVILAAIAAMHSQGSR